ncbi:hypothetical protein CRUP_010205, partial [Coryphaenoides rupestris]
MRVSRKGQVVCALEADWLELTAAYYRKGWSLVDAFVYWDTPKGESAPRSMEGLFVYEECGSSPSPPANDTIVVEQWTVIEGSSVKTDYGPLLHTLAEFGWLLTCVLPTPIIRHDRAASRAAAEQGGGGGGGGASLPPAERSPTAGGIGGFPVFGDGFPGSLSHLEEGGFDQDEGKAEVTCICWADDGCRDDVASPSSQLLPSKVST